jgi:hypothetical protein
MIYLKTFDKLFEVATKREDLITTDKSEIAKFVEQMPISDSKFIKNFISQNESRLDLTRTVMTPSGEQLTVNVGFGVDFFRPFF